MYNRFVGGSNIKFENNVGYSKDQNSYYFNNNLPSVDFKSNKFEDKEFDEVDEFSSVTSKGSSQSKHEEVVASGPPVTYDPTKYSYDSLLEHSYSDFSYSMPQIVGSDYSYQSDYYNSMQESSFRNVYDQNLLNNQSPSIRTDHFVDQWNKDPCWARWSKLYDDSQKVCLWQVPPERRKKPLDSTGWRHWGWKGCSQVPSTRKRDLKRHRNSVWETDGNEIDRNGKNWSKKRKQLSELISKISGAERPLLGFGIPFRSYSYIFGKNSNKNNDQTNKKQGGKFKRRKYDQIKEDKSSSIIENVLNQDEFDGSTEIEETLSNSNEHTLEIKQEEEQSLSEQTDSIKTIELPLIEEDIKQEVEVNEEFNQNI